MHAVWIYAVCTCIEHVLRSIISHALFKYTFWLLSILPEIYKVCNTFYFYLEGCNPEGDLGLMLATCVGPMAPMLL